MSYKSLKGCEEKYTDSSLIYSVVTDSISMIKNIHDDAHRKQKSYQM